MGKTMDNHEAIERVSAGLRKMDSKPDALLFLDEGNFTWDLDEIMGIPVFHGELLRSKQSGTMVSDVLFQPIFKKENGSNYMDTVNFLKGFDEYQS